MHKVVSGTTTVPKIIEENAKTETVPGNGDQPGRDNNAVKECLETKVGDKSCSQLTANMLEKATEHKQAINEKVGDMAGKKRKVEIKIVDYDPQWPDLFKQHSDKIKSALGDAALRVEHIGSTSVECLAAKPIIDILLNVKDPGDEASYVPQLEEKGYIVVVREPDFYDHRMLRTPIRDVHIHVFSPDSPENDRYLILRNELRRNPEIREKYETLKRELAKKSWERMDDYAQEKGDFIEKTIADAKGSF